MQRRDVLKRVVWSTIIVLIVALYFVFDPSQYEWFPKCLLRWITGFDCPGCGMQRMAHAILHADFEAAFYYNAFVFVFIMPVALLYAVAYLIPKGRAERFKYIVYHSSIIVVLLVLTLIWWFFRNTEFWLNIASSHL